MVRRRPSENLFQLRLESLIEERGVEGVVRLTGRSRESIRRWRTGTQRPQASIARQIVRRGRTQDNVIPRNVQSQFRRGEIPRDTITAMNVENRYRRRQVNRLQREEEAGLISERNREVMEQQFAPVSTSEAEDITSLFEQRDEALEAGYDEYGYDWWNDWREALEEAGYTSESSA